MADDQQFEPLSQFMTPQSLAMLRLQQQQQALEAARQQSGVNYAARVGGMSLGNALTGGPMAPQNTMQDRIAANNLDMFNRSGVGQPTGADEGPGLPSLEIQARRYESLAQMLARNGQVGAAAQMQDVANVRRQLQADLEAKRAQGFEATEKGNQAIAEAAKARRFAVWKIDPDQSDVAANKTRYVDQNGYEPPQIREQGNLPDYTTTEVNATDANGNFIGSQTAVYDKHNGRLELRPGVKPYLGQVNMDVAKDLLKKISTINQGRVAMARADAYINDAVGPEAALAQHGGNIVNLFTKGSANPASTRAIAAVDTGNQLARAALRVTGRYANAQDRQINELLPETEGLTRNPQHERTKLWGTEEQLANEEAILRKQYAQVTGNDARALPPPLPTLVERDQMRRQPPQAPAPQAAPPQAGPQPQQAGFAPPAPVNTNPMFQEPPGGNAGRPGPRIAPQAADNAPATERKPVTRTAKLKDGRTVTYVVH